MWDIDTFKRNMDKALMWHIYDPKSRLEVGQFVRCHLGPDSVDIAYIVEFVNDKDALVMYIDDIDTDVVECELLSPIPANEVVVNLGSGITGVVTGRVWPDSNRPTIGICNCVVGEDGEYMFATVDTGMLDDDVRTVIDALLSRIDKESK